MHQLIRLNNRGIISKKAFLLKSPISKPFDALNQLYLKRTQLSFTKCSVENCTNSNIEIHHVCTLKVRIEKNNPSVIITQGKKVSG